MKQCFKCGKRKSVSEFYKHGQMASSVVGKCKECTKTDVKLNYRAKRLQYHDYEQKRERRPERRKAKAEYQRLHRSRHPRKYRARSAVGNAIRDGRLIRQPCRVCGGKAQAHHKNYNRPLEIDWLCFKDHRQLEHGQVIVNA